MKKIQKYYDLLIEDFEIRKKKNPAFSIRAFAKVLQISPAHLNFVMAGKRHLSHETANKILGNLKWENSKKDLFITLLDYHHSRSNQNKEDTKKRIQNHKVEFLELHDDSFIVLTSWYNSAILNFLALDKSRIGLNKNNTIEKKISDYFSLDLQLVEIAIKRLERLKLIRKDGLAYALTKNHFQIPSRSSEAIRNFHKSILKLAEVAIENQDFNERDFSGIMFNLKKDKLPEAKKKIESFRKEMAALMADENNDEVYQLSIQLFKLGK